MPEMRIVLGGEAYPSPRYYGTIAWSADGRDVYIRHPGGGKDSRHRDGRTYLTSTEAERYVETRAPTSDITQERVNVVTLPAFLSEPPVLSGAVRATDLLLHSSSVGTVPRLAVEIVANQRLPDVIAGWQSHSGVASVTTQVDKGLGQTLLVALLSTSS